MHSDRHCGIQRHSCSDPPHRPRRWLCSAVQHLTLCGTNVAVSIHLPGAAPLTRTVSAPSRIPRGGTLFERLARRPRPWASSRRESPVSLTGGVAAPRGCSPMPASSSRRGREPPGDRVDPDRRGRRALVPGPVLDRCARRVRGRPRGWRRSSTTEEDDGQRRTTSVVVPLLLIEVFELFTDRFSEPAAEGQPSHRRSGTPPRCSSMPVPGGRWYERAEDGSECDWGQVLEIERPEPHRPAWHLTPERLLDPEPRPRRPRSRSPSFPRTSSHSRDPHPQPLRGPTARPARPCASGRAATGAGRHRWASTRTRPESAQACRTVFPEIGILRGPGSRCRRYQGRRCRGRRR